MAKVLCILSILLLAGCSVSAQDATKSAAGTAAADFKVPPEASKLANPVKPTAESLSHGKKVYDIDCSLCHGQDGDGKGDLATDMKLKLVDYRDPSALKDFTDGDLFYIIKNGKGDMPSEGDRAKADSIWNLVNYIHSLAKKDSSAKSKLPTP
jgi:mono/diheme cytochrome c family protein